MINLDGLSNNDAEQFLLGALLLDNRVYQKVCDIVSVEHFSVAPHSRIFGAISSLIGEGRLADTVTLTPFFVNDSGLTTFGGATYLADIAATVYTVAQAVDHALLIRDLWVRRSVVAIAGAASAKASSPAPGEKALDLVTEIERSLGELGDSGSRRIEVITLAAACATAVTAIDETVKRGDRLTGITTGLADLNWRTGGMVKGELTVLAGRPGMGKSDLGLSIALAAAASGEGVVVFSQEMTAQSLSMRYLAQRTQIAASDMRSGRLEVEQVSTLALERTDLTLWIDETPAIECDHIIRAVRRQRARRNPVGLIVVDHIQLMRADGLTRLNETAMTTEISGRLKALSKSLDVHVLALSQLNRAVEAREDKRPTLSDLRSSGSIEQDADMVLGLYRDEYYAKLDEPKKRQDESEDKFDERVRRWERRMVESKNLADIICLKLRSGPVGTCTVFYEAKYSLFRDLARR